MPAPRALAAGLLLGIGVTTGATHACPAGAQEGDPQVVAESFASGEYDVALAEAARLPDPVLASEWATYIYAEAGDLPGSLHAARAGLELAPQNVGLLVNALSAALTLGLSGLSLDLAQRLDRLSTDPEGAERAARFLAQARQLVELDETGTRRARHARWTVLVGLGVLLALMGALASRSSAPSWRQT